MSEYKLSTYDISKVFKVQIKTVDNWIKGETHPSHDIVNAMIFAYRFMQFWKPFSYFLGIIKLILKRTIIALLKYLYKIISNFMKGVWVGIKNYAK